MNKKEYREYMQDKRNSLSPQQMKEYEAQIADRVLQSSIYKAFDHICVYQAFRNEVACDVIQARAFADGKLVFVPVTDPVSKTMDFYRITQETEWIEGAYGILEPDGERIPLRDRALILMPGLVYDRNRHRIGYGGGYYDRYLASHPGNVTVALCYPFQIIEDALPFEPHDILPDYLAAPDGFIGDM